MSATLLERLNPSLYLPQPARIVTVQPMTEQQKMFTLELPDGLTLGHRPGAVCGAVGVGRGRSSHLHFVIAQPHQWQL